MQNVDALVDELKTLIIEHLNLEDVDPEKVDPVSRFSGRSSCTRARSRLGNALMLMPPLLPQPRA